ncbi:MAG: hypothetical protein K0U68_10635 [Gammaproteobacteria bacterium]|nr:hypothetical protein [Gammaproteobacteria bacterium]
MLGLSLSAVVNAPPQATRFSVSHVFDSDVSIGFNTQMVTQISPGARSTPVEPVAQ